MVQTTNDRITNLTKDLELLNNEKIKLETRKEQTEEDLAKVLEEIKQHGYKPEELDEAIKKAEKDLYSELSALEQEVQNIKDSLEEV
jgi:predicted  nucleic acid-binding Zn-ribbon protein